MTKKQNETPKELKRYKLDVSSQFYPIMATKKSQSLFRITALMDSEVDPAVLKRALNSVIDRFPTFKVRLKKGYAWFYFEENPDEIIVSPASGQLLRPIDPKETAGSMFRFEYDGDAIIFEVFHAICDGTGAMAFFKAVIYRYRELSGAVLADKSGIIDFDKADLSGEIEDSFEKYYRPIRFGDVELGKFMGAAPQLLPGTPSDEYSCETATARFADMNKAAKRHGTTFTAFVTALLASSIEKITRGKRPIVMMVPVNLRSIFPSETLRNFSTFVRLVFNPKQCVSLEDYIREATSQLKEKATEKELTKFISTTVRSERSFIMKIAPVWFKILAARLGRFLLKSRQTIIFSNLGRIVMPEGIGVKRLELNVNVSKTAKVNLGALTFGENVYFSFSRSIKETLLQQEFLKQLATEGVPASPLMQFKQHTSTTNNFDITASLATQNQ